MKTRDALTGFAWSVVRFPLAVSIDPRRTNERAAIDNWPLDAEGTGP